jgi:hypothetical protein
MIICTCSASCLRLVFDLVQQYFSNIHLKHEAEQVHIIISYFVGNCFRKAFENSISDLRLKLRARIIKIVKDIGNRQN